MDQPTPNLIHPRSWNERMMAWGEKLGQMSQPQLRGKLTWAAGGLTLLLFVVDYFSGYQVTLRFAYCVPIALMLAARGKRAAFGLAVVCDLGWLACDVAGGAQYASVFVPIWNLSITFANYTCMILLLGGLLAWQRDLEQRVQVRTAALREEIALREALEREMLNIAEKERRALGHDLHDGLCQHFTATALAAQLLARRLEEQGSPVNADAHRIVSLIEDGIGQTRRLAQGFVLVTVEIDGLTAALREMAATSAQQFRVPCTFEMEGAPEVKDVLVATHLFRIAQEAVRNAVRHGRATRVAVSVSGDARSVHIRVVDNGVGLPGPELRGRGMGLRIMAYRAQAVGARFQVGEAPGGGTALECDWREAGIAA